MPKEFYTEKDIEDLVKRGVLSLDVTENVVLTELAYEKANRLGMKLVRTTPDNPPAAPVRPYISQKPAPGPVAAAIPPAAPTAAPRPAAPGGDGDLPARIRSAVISKLGNQVDPALLDVIIQRVLKSTGVK
jgi:hypothetical protein